MKRYAGKQWKTSAAALVAAALLVGCTVTAPVAPASKADLSRESTAAQTVHGADPSAADSTEEEAKIERLTFTAQESTFLSAIEAAMAVRGEPDSRFYVELTTADGVTWQGERLAYTDGDVYFLQQAEHDGRSAVRVEASPGAVPESFTAMLPEAMATAGDPPNVDVQYVRARQSDPESSTWSFDVTVAHPDTGWEDYTDGWHVETLDGQVLGMRILLHPHVNEQPFTRGLSNVGIPEGIEEIRIRPHDLVSGYGSATAPIPLAEAATGEWFEVVRRP